MRLPGIRTAMNRSWNRRVGGSAVGARWVRRSLLTLAGIGMCLSWAGSAEAQTREEQAFLRSAANHFGFAEREVAFLAQGGASPDEIPVVLHLAREAGVSAEAILALRRGGHSWTDLLRRYGMHAGQLYVDLETVPREGALGRAYEAFAGRPRASWEVIRLPDDQIVALVALGFLTRYLQMSPERVAAALAGSLSPVEAYRTLLGRRSA